MHASMIWFSLLAPLYKCPVVITFTKLSCEVRCFGPIGNGNRLLLEAEIYGAPLNKIKLLATSELYNVVYFDLKVSKRCIIIILLALLIGRG